MNNNFTECAPNITIISFNSTFVHKFKIFINEMMQNSYSYYVLEHNLKENSTQLSYLLELKSCSMLTLLISY